MTGGNTGLGREAAKHIARLQAQRLIIACRNVAKGEEARSYIQEQTSSKTTIEVWALDLGSFDSVKLFAQRARGLERLDAVLENAGMWPSAFESLENHECSSFRLKSYADPPLTFRQSYHYSQRDYIVSLGASTAAKAARHRPADGQCSAHHNCHLATS